MQEALADERLKVNFLPVTITAGGKSTRQGNQWHVPKGELVSSLELLLERGWLKVASAAPQSDLLREELRQFERRSKKGGGSVLGAAHGRQDDLVMALAMAGWWALKNRKGALSGPELKALD